MLMSDVSTSGIRLDRIAGAQAYTTIDLIPEGEYDEYLFRGASIGELALNVACGRLYINREHGGLDMHVAQSHDVALNFAYDMSAKRSDMFQFTEGDAIEFERLSGVEAIGIPGIVLGLPRSIYGAKLEMSKSNIPEILRERVPFSVVDSYSRAYLEFIFGINLTT
jgi:hypothetical protein